MRNIKLTLEYDGSDFFGWQRQAEGRTVQGVLENALKNLLQDSPKTYASGRTDSGVHAVAQVVNFKTDSQLSIEKIRLGLNRYLPVDVKILHVAQVADEFHARFSALKRIYEYHIAKMPVAINRHYVWFCRFHLDKKKLGDGAQYIIGRHSFEALSKVNPKEKHYLCDVEYANWYENEHRLVFEICANRFLHRMVRIIVGTLVEVGRGNLEPVAVKNIIESKNRNLAGASVPAKGLFLKQVIYE